VGLSGGGESHVLWENPRMRDSEVEHVWVVDLEVGELILSH
jgi:hypothetical protein